ncbi:hypothetical protein GIB67_029017 [Kingdonia uniflora]|uniref:Uncharacterized protein n=1 Tax=Kingdonia uniflora TaxID=39325 RepID=A0A7J7N770_9MAGN|nr:hypothetical protein GIB67_029017 [Kingdonia uniflora]
MITTTPTVSGKQLKFEEGTQRLQQQQQTGRFRQTTAIIRTALAAGRTDHNNTGSFRQAVEV